MGKPEKYDFSGWATKSNIKCSDGRTILKHAFKNNSGKNVPLVWNHNHNEASNVLGHAYLEDREEGVYAYCSFNGTENAKNAKELVEHGDIASLSIFANKLQQTSNKEVVHGNILEVSLVLAGANPGASIDYVVEHADTEESESATIYNDEETLEMFHSEEVNEENTIQNNDSNQDAQANQDDQTHQEDSSDKNGEADQNSDLEHNEKTNENNGSDDQNNSDSTLSHKDKEGGKEKTVEEIVNSMTEEQKQVLYLLVGAAAEEAKNKNTEGEKNMKHNVFDQIKKDNGEVLTHSEFVDIIEEAKTSTGSLKKAFLAHSITNIENLFPEERAAGAPETVSRDMEWVAQVMGAVSHSPFSRVKSMYFDITGEQARAKGYIKGHQKAEEVITALKRSVSPQTVYKLQKLDRDDVVDITDFDVISYIKSEMRTMLNEELARAMLIGDGRSVEDEHKISTEHIKPIWGDSEVYTVKRVLERPANISDEAFAKMLIKEVIKARKLYKGSGNPTFYTTEDMLTNMLLIEDKNERVIYDTVEKLKTALRVKDIVTVEPMEGASRTEGNFTYELLGLFVNMRDYKVGADKGGAVNMFDDFDINYNKLEYLIETRCSGALVKPYSAISFELKKAASASPAAPANNN